MINIDYDTMDWPECRDCGDEYHPRRKELGYSVCLECGDKKAQKSIAHKKKCSAPLFNKGGYGYISSKEAAKSIGRQTMSEVGLYAFKLQEMMEAAGMLAAFVGGVLLISYLTKKTR